MRTISTFVAVGSFVAAGTMVAAAQQPWIGGGTLSATGKIIGPEQHPEPGVPVEVKGSWDKTFAVTDQNGRWSVYNLPAGKYDVAPTDAYKAPDSHGSTFTVEETSKWQNLFGGAQQRPVEIPEGWQGISSSRTSTVITRKPKRRV